MGKMQENLENVYENQRPDAKRNESMDGAVDRACLLVKLTMAITGLVLIAILVTSVTLHLQQESALKEESAAQALTNSKLLNATRKREQDLDEMKKKFQALMGAQYQNISNLAASLSDANKEIGRLKNKTDACPLSYDGKCFWAEINKNGYLYCDEADDVCKLRGGKAANVYSQLHHHMLMGYLRMMIDHGGHITAWLGMKYDQKSNGVLLSDGTAAPYLQWHPGYPNREFCCCMAVHVVADIASQYQHMHNFKNTDVRHGVLCER